MNALLIPLYLLLHFWPALLVVLIFIALLKFLLKK